MLSYPNDFSSKKQALPIYYQSYLKYRELVGWILHEDWMELDSSGEFHSVALRERLYCKELKDANVK